MQIQKAHRRKRIGTVYDYYYVDGKLVYEKRGNTLAFYYCYDANGNVALIRRVILSSGAVGNFYTILNAQGDVVGLRNYAGTVLAKYTYDSWVKQILGDKDDQGRDKIKGSDNSDTGFHTVDDIFRGEKGASYLSIMEKNLVVLKDALK